MGCALTHILMHSKESVFMGICEVLSASENCLNHQGSPIEFKGFPGGSVDKESACNAGDRGFSSWVGKILWRRKWQPTPVFLPGESHE